MAKISRQVGTTGQLVDVLALNNSVTTGAGLTGLAYNTAGLTCYYHRNTANASVAVTLATMTLGTWATGGFIVADGTNMPGCYQLGIPNAALASGADSVVIYLQGATNMAPVVLEIELTATSNQDAVHGGMSALPNASPGAAGGVFIAGTNAATVITTSLTTHLVGTVDTVTTYTGNTPQTGDSYARIGSTGSGLTSLAPASTALSTATWTAPPTGFLAAAFPSTVSSYAGGAVASVTGAVGSVTAAVTVSLTQALSAARALDTVADTSLTLNDALHCAIAGAVGQASVATLAYTVETPHTATVLRTFTIDSNTAPTVRS